MKQILATELERTQKLRTELLLKLYESRTFLIKARKTVNEIEQEMNHLDDDIGYWVSMNNSNYEGAEYFKKKIANRRRGLFGQKDR